MQRLCGGTAWQRARAFLADSFQFEETPAGRWVAFLAGAHDLGKATRSFRPRGAPRDLQAQTGVAEWHTAGILLLPNGLGPRRQRRSAPSLGGSFRTKAEAKAAERRLLQERDAGSDLRKSKITITEVCRQYLGEKAGKGKSSSRQRSQELLAHVERLLGQKPATQLRPADISAAYAALQQNLSKRTVRHVHWQLHAALELAVRWGQLQTNVVAHVSPPSPDAFEARALTKDEVTKLLDAVRGKSLGPLIMTAIDTGAREGELLALRWSDLDLDRSVVHISRSVRRSKGQWEFSTPKTKRSRRAVGISPPTVAVLKSHRQRQLEGRLRLGEAWTDLDLVFPTARGTPQNASEVSKSLRKLASDAGLEGFRFHDLRHSSVSLLLAGGESMADVSRRVGHSGIGTTVDTYGHLLGAAPSLAATMGAILEDSVRDPDRWLANG